MYDTIRVRRLTWSIMKTPGILNPYRWVIYGLFWKSLPITYLEEKTYSYYSTRKPFLAYFLFEKVKLHFPSNPLYLQTFCTVDIYWTRHKRTNALET